MQNVARGKKLRIFRSLSVAHHTKVPFLWLYRSTAETHLFTIFTERILMKFAWMCEFTVHFIIFFVADFCTVNFQQVNKMGNQLVKHIFVIYIKNSTIEVDFGIK